MFGKKLLLIKAAIDSRINTVMKALMKVWLSLLWKLSIGYLIVLIKSFERPMENTEVVMHKAKYNSM